MTTCSRLERNSPTNIYTSDLLLRWTESAYTFYAYIVVWVFQSCYLHCLHQPFHTSCNYKNVARAGVMHSRDFISQIPVRVVNFYLTYPILDLVSICTEFKLANCTCASGLSCFMNFDPSFLFWLFSCYLVPFVSVSSCWPCFSRKNPCTLRSRGAYCVLEAFKRLAKAYTTGHFVSVLKVIHTQIACTFTSFSGFPTICWLLAGWLAIKN